MSEEIIIRCTGVRKSYRDGVLDVEVLRGVYFRLDRGEQVAIIGSGKSTLMHVMAGLDTIDDGLIELNGESISAYSEARRGDIRNRFLGFVYQFHHLLPEFTALENVAMPLLIRRTSDEESMSAAETILKRKTDCFINRPSFRAANVSASPLRGHLSRNRFAYLRMSRPEIWTAKQRNPFMN